MLIHEHEPLNAEPPREALAQLPLTPLESFYVRGHGPVPDDPAAGWRLQIAGMVERECAWSLGELRDGRFTEWEVVATLQCAGNRRNGLIEVRDIPGETPWGPGATGTASWRGVRVRDL
ncbi:MAG: molybdopterin-dependent oxidoreductase, partial [Solirubrobacteraceae bacterium]